MRRRFLSIALLIALCPLGTGCTFVSKAADFNGLPGPRGKPVEYFTATKVGLHFLFIFPLAGNISVASTVDELTARMKEDGLTNVRIVQSGSQTLWFIFMPLTFVVHPVVTSVSADGEIP